METTARPSRKQRRQQIKQELFAWLSQQPDHRVLETEFNNKVGRPSDIHALFASRDFVVYTHKGERWVAANNARGGELDAARKESALAEKQRRMLLKQDVLRWLAGRPDQMATKDEFRQQFGPEKDAEFDPGRRSLCVLRLPGETLAAAQGISRDGIPG